MSEIAQEVLTTTKHTLEGSSQNVFKRFLNFWYAFNATKDVICFGKFHLLDNPITNNLLALNQVTVEVKAASK